MLTPTQIQRCVRLGLGVGDDDDPPTPLLPAQSEDVPGDTPIHIAFHIARDPTTDSLELIEGNPPDTPAI